ncbi:PQQ-binding-like beta-propeller repeat protein [Natrarchaeobaculum aegyptiacum]|uniref:Pyrrolo-quinoline quinone n=1 Tax=Natrarchaeobaculum aegyptiacum TaxID=745377 RepID=A0A2Z2HTF5_9EURY|nr:PQQ-binding-like beta-propeller repeat protein [Natrarchaeobaculum aegyptiacum]ARS90073.1 pyrrolo-quinoline quinone [Natrarchaeobaculum aegyptiacum]
MPSRRSVLAAGSLAASALAGCTRAADGPTSSADARVAADAADWPMARYDPAGTGHAASTAGPRDDVQVAWERDPGERVRSESPPILLGDTLYVVGRRSLIALGRDTGDVRFTRNGSYQSTPARVVASAYRTPTLAVASTAGLYGLSADGGFELLGLEFGSERWYGPGSEPDVFRIGPPAEPAPVAADGTVYAVDPGTDRLLALDGSSGSLEWKRTIGDGRSIGTNRPAVRDGTVYVSSRPGDLVAVDAETGDRDWDVRPDAHEGSSLRYRNFRPPTATAAGLVVPDREGVTLFDPANGDVLWEYTHDGNLTGGTAAVADGTVFVPDGRDSLHAIDLESGDEIWTVDYGYPVRPIVSDGVVYLGYRSLPELIALDAETGERRWSFEGESGFSQPIVADGVLYATGWDGVVALEEASQ